MNKIIINSKYFLKQLEVLDKFHFLSVQIFASQQNVNFKFSTKETNLVGIVNMNCECENDFELPFYKASITNLIKHLRLIKEQPITLQFSDSETLNVKICEMII